MAKYKPVGNANWGECDYCLEQPMVTRYDVEYEVYESGPPVKFICRPCMNKIVNREPRTVDVAIWRSGHTVTPLGIARNVKRGKITSSRALMNYGIHYLYQHLDGIANAKLADMPKAIDLLRKQIDQVARDWDETLKLYGDTDPRHEGDSS